VNRGGDLLGGLLKAYA